VRSAQCRRAGASIYANALTPRLLGRETKQLAVVAGLTLLAFIFGPGWLKAIAGVVDLLLALVCVAALIVAWRVAVSRRQAVVVYATAAVVFAALAVLNFAA